MFEKAKVYGIRQGTISEAQIVKRVLSREFLSFNNKKSCLIENFMMLATLFWLQKFHELKVTCYSFSINVGSAKQPS